MSKIIIVSNRLPIKAEIIDNKISYQKSEGGLATGLDAVFSKNDKNIWLGWPGITSATPEMEQEITQALAKDKLMPIFLSKKEYLNYYEGFSNGILWPLFHYFPEFTNYRSTFWKAYITVNQQFAESIYSIAEKGDTIWIQDYHLLLLPELIRKKYGDTVKIGFFQHIPFPSFEVFRLLPWRKEILKGMLGADLLGFHTIEDVNHFLDSVLRFVGARIKSNSILLNQHTAVAEAFPMGIDFEKFNDVLPTLPNTKIHLQNLQEKFQGSDVILSIDRLDYSKGIIPRIRGFEHFLTKYPEKIEKVSLFMIVVPSRSSVADYAKLKNEIDKLVGDINARFRTLNWLPIHYFYQSFSPEYLSALYQLASICLVTPMRDGMNLVCKEFVASRKNEDGVLILSEMAGASKELFSAVIVNPNDIRQISQSIYEGLKMPLEEQQRRMKEMRYIVSKFNIHHWVKIFLTKLDEIQQLQAANNSKYIYPQVKAFSKLFNQAKSRIIVLDYDGTLVGFANESQKAIPNEELYEILKKLYSDPQNHVIIVSGRNNEFLEQYFGNLPIDLIGEHGVWHKYQGQEWQKIHGLNNDWKSTIGPKLEILCDRTPGAFVEEKSYSLAWHYRNVDEELGKLRANEMVGELNHFLSNKGLQVLFGDKVIEIKRFDINKGIAIRNWIESRKIQYDISLSFGDDVTDEDIFEALQSDKDYTVKVGQKLSKAKYYVSDFTEVRNFLKAL